MVYRRRGSSRYWLTVAHHRRAGEYVHLPTRTRDEATAKAMGAMLVALGPAGQRRFELLDWLLRPKRGRDDLARLYDHFLAGTLDQLRAEMADRDLAPGIAAWDTQLEQAYRGDTPRNYRRTIATLFPREPKEKGGAYRPLMRSAFLAPGFIAGKLAQVAGSRTNRRRHHECYTSACAYLVEHGYLEANPMAGVTKAKPDKGRELHIAKYSDVLRFVNAFPPGMYRAAAALIEGSGMELQAVQAFGGRDVVSIEDRVVWAHGGKNDHRDRQVLVDAECFEAFLAYYRSQGWLPDARLFPFHADAFRRVHRKVCAELRTEGVDIPVGYSPHAGRHTLAIRWTKRRVEDTLIANNLGHASTASLKRYAKYRPKITDIVRASATQGGA